MNLEKLNKGLFKKVWFYEPQTGGGVNKKGFTLVEIILAISLIGALFATTAYILERGISSFAAISVRGKKHQDARYAMERMVRELLLVSVGSQGDLISIQNTQVSFKDQAGLNTNFNLNGQTLSRGSDILLENVTGLTFTGYNSNNQTTQSNPQVRRIRIQITTLPQGQTAPLTFRTDVFLRGEEMYENFQ